MFVLLLDEIDRELKQEELQQTAVNAGNEDRESKRVHLIEVIRVEVRGSLATPILVLVPRCSCRKLPRLGQ